jgi:hypothetical protein
MCRCLLAAASVREEISYGAACLMQVGIVATTDAVSGWTRQYAVVAIGIVLDSEAVFREQACDLGLASFRGVLQQLGWASAESLACLPATLLRALLLRPGCWRCGWAAFWQCNAPA